MKFLRENNLNYSLFIIAGGLLLSLITVIYFLFIADWLPNNVFIYYAVLYFIEFLFYCLALFLFKQIISKKIWFLRGVLVLSLITGVKIFISSIVLYVILEYMELFVDSGLFNLLAILGPHIRGFIFEFIAIGLAVKLFETDIFVHEKFKDDDNVLDGMQ